jgi:diguanylate cyclase (GGDEF)-like protein
MQTDVSRWSRNAVEYFGLPGEYMEHAGGLWESYIHPDDRAAYQKDIEEVFSGKKKQHELEYRARNKEGNYVICTCRGVVLKGEKEGEQDLFAGTITNNGIVSNIDATTNLYNIYEFMSEIQKLRNRKAPGLVMMLGINGFRNINNVYGYGFGNQVLKAFADLLIEMTCGLGMVFRMNGSKFAICFRQTDDEQAKKFYEKLQQKSRDSIIVDEKHVPISISGGAVHLDNSGSGEQSVRSCASYVLEKSKREYHSKLVFFENMEGANNMRSLELLESIRESVLSGCQGFYLTYQPLVNACDGRIRGMEALLRWHQEPYGEVPPGAFIEWLEQDDCFYELGNWILLQALTDGVKMVKEQPDFIVNVNVSYTQFERGDFRDNVMDILWKTGFPPENLCIELTERCKMLDVERLRQMLDFFGSYGIKVALDDFGTENSSLNLLRELPIQCLKIDRTFISNIQTNRNDEIIVEMVIDGANKLGVDVCLEGIENEELRDYVKKFNADSYQGYFYSRPVRIEDFHLLWEKGREEEKKMTCLPKGSKEKAV